MIKTGNDRKGNFGNRINRIVNTRRDVDIDGCRFCKWNIEIIDTTAIIGADRLFARQMEGNISGSVQPVVQIQTTHHFLRKQNDQQYTCHFQY